MMLPTLSRECARSDSTLYAEPRQSLHDLLQASAALHSHLCPRQVLGVRMGMWAGELLALELPQVNKRLLVIVESDGCFADGVATATNCWVGRRTLRVADYGKSAATFVDTETGVALRLSPHPTARQLAQAYAPEAADRWEAMLLGYQRIEASRLFCVQRVTLKQPLAQIISRPGLRRRCDRCGEEIINEREVTVGKEGGKEGGQEGDKECLCQACAGNGYYDLVRATVHVEKVNAGKGDAEKSNAGKAASSDDAVPDWLESSVAQRNHELMALFDISQEIVAQLDLDTLLGTISDHARALLGAQAALLCLLNAEGDALQLAISSGWEGVAAGLSQSTARGLAADVVGSGLTVVTPAPCTNCAVLRKFGPGTCVAVPLRAGENALGALCVVRAPDQAFDADQARSLRLLANAAAIAITNARLADAARQEAARVAACAEREHLAAELHDNLAQTLAFLNLKTGVLGTRLQEALGARDAGVELAAMAAAIATAYAQVRAALTGLQRPPALTGDLASALRQSVAEFRAATGIEAELFIDDEAATALSAVAQSQVKHIVREALTNIRRHAHAGHVQVRVEHSDGAASLVVNDDGCGFDLHKVDVEHHLGLAIMQRRAMRCGGQLRVNSVPGAGTKIAATFPLELGEEPGERPGEKSGGKEEL